MELEGTRRDVANAIVCEAELPNPLFLDIICSHARVRCRMEGTEGGRRRKSQKLNKNIEYDDGRHNDQTLLKKKEKLN